MPTPNDPPKAWFDRPKFDGPTSFTYDHRTGRVFGHIAQWSVAHVGARAAGKTIRAPRAVDGYTAFKAKNMITAEGDVVKVGHMLFGGGHSFTNGQAITASESQAFHEQNSHIGAFVNIGEDATGIWVAGVVNPALTDEQLREFIGGTPSGEWLPEGGDLVLRHTVQVNNPGYPVFKKDAALAASAAPDILPLAASFAADLTEEPPLDVEETPPMADHMEETAAPAPVVEAEPVEEAPAAPKRTAPKPAPPKTAPAPEAEEEARAIYAELSEAQLSAIAGAVRAVLDEHEAKRAQDAELLRTRRELAGE